MIEIGERARRRRSFNEAPIHESGKCGRPDQANPRVCSFNEAPIHESGKCNFCIMLYWESIRFNEAPIHESGKYVDAELLPKNYSCASMRPRFMNRGSSKARN